MQTPIHAEIIGSDRCQAEGLTVRGATPVLATCRKLLNAGYVQTGRCMPSRGEMLAFKVRSIGEGAKLTVREDRCRFARLPDREAGGGVASLVRPKPTGATRVAQPPPDAPANQLEPAIEQLAA